MEHMLKAHGPKAPSKKFRLPVTVPIVLALLVFAVDLMEPMGMAVWVPYLALVVLASRARSPRFLLLFSAASAVLLVIGYFIDLAPPSIDPGIGLFNRVLGVIAISVTAMLCRRQLLTEASLETLVRERTGELEQANTVLQTEATERKRLIVQLQEALAKVTALQGILPLCRICRKIRDDRGSWSEINAYLRDHSDAKVIHSVCPECAKNPQLP